MNNVRFHTHNILLVRVTVLITQLLIASRVQATDCQATLPASSPVDTGLGKRPDASLDWYGEYPLAALILKNGQWIGNSV